MGGSTSTYKLPEELYETLICSECNAYLSCTPIKLLPNGKYLCGRCTFTTYVPQALYEKIMKNALFPCQHKKKGCSEYLSFNKVQEHETKCMYRTYRCPSSHNLTCNELICLKETKDHFTKHHPTHIIQNEQFVLEMMAESKNSLVLFPSYDAVIVQYQYKPKERNLLIDLSCITDKPDKVLNYSLQFLNINNNDSYCSVLSKKTCPIFENLIMNDAFTESIGMEPYLTILKNPSKIIVKISIT